MRELPQPTLPLSDLRLHRPTPVAPRAARAPVERFSVGWAKHQDEVREAQRLRYQVFVEAMGLESLQNSEGLEKDDFDDYCDHLLVRDTRTLKVVGTNDSVELDYTARTLIQASRWSAPSALGRQFMAWTQARQLAANGRRELWWGVATGSETNATIRVVLSGLADDFEAVACRVFSGVASDQSGAPTPLTADTTGVTTHGIGPITPAVADSVVIFFAGSGASGISIDNCTG